MIFINRDNKVIMIPKHVNYAGSMKLTLKHNLTGVDYVFDDIPNDDTSTLFWTFTDLDFSKIPTGEYTYSLNGVETGLLVVNSLIEDPISYNSEKTIVQYGDR